MTVNWNNRRICQLWSPELNRGRTIGKDDENAANPQSQSHFTHSSVTLSTDGLLRNLIFNSQICLRVCDRGLVTNDIYFHMVKLIETFLCW